MRKQIRVLTEKNNALEIELFETISQSERQKCEHSPPAPQLKIELVERSTQTDNHSNFHPSIPSPPVQEITTDNNLKPPLIPTENIPSQNELIYFNELQNERNRTIQLQSRVTELENLVQNPTHAKIKVRDFSLLFFYCLLFSFHLSSCCPKS